MESPSLQEENIIKNVRKRFILEKLKKEITDTTIKAKRNLFRLEKENEKIKDIRNFRNLIRNLFMPDKENNAKRYKK